MEILLKHQVGYEKNFQTEDVYKRQPYMFDRVEGDTYTFIRNPYYWDEAPEVDEFKVKVIPDNAAKILALRNGEIDAILGSSRLSAEGYTCLLYTSPCKINLVILSLLCFFCTADDLCFSVCRQAVAWKCRETGGISPVYAGSDPGDVLSY